MLSALGLVELWSGLFRKTSAEDIRLIIRRYEKDFDICGYHQTLNDLRTLLKIKTQGTKSRWHLRIKVNRDNLVSKFMFSFCQKSYVTRFQNDTANLQVNLPQNCCVFSLQVYFQKHFNKKMLESRPEDALVKLVKTVETEETVEDCRKRL